MESAINLYVLTLCMYINVLLKCGLLGVFIQKCDATLDVFFTFKTVSIKSFLFRMYLSQMKCEPKQESSAKIH